MWAMGFTLNIITLLALALAVGIVIDDAIVVLENIVRFIEEKKQKPFVAAVLATRDIGLAVLATTLSLMAVFLPVAFMSGIIGRFLKSFGLTMAFAILVSLLVSFSLTPMLAARWLDAARRPRGSDAQKSLLERIVDGFYRPIESLYMAVLRWVDAPPLGRRRCLACATLGSCVPLAAAVPKGFTPPNDVAEFDVNVRAPEGTSLAETRLLAERVARDIRALPGVDHTLVTIGNDSSVTRNLANIFVHLVDPRVRDGGPVRDHGPRAQGDRPAAAEGAPHRRVADGADLERPVAGAGPVHAQRARPEPARALHEHDPRALPTGARARSTSTRTSSSATPRCTSRSTASARATSASTWPTWPTRSSSSSAG